MYPHIDSVGILNQLSYYRNEVFIMENNNKNINNAAMREEERKAEFFKAVELIGNLMKGIQEKETAIPPRVTPNFTAPEATTTTRTRIQNITTELQDELELQMLEIANKSTGVDLDVLQNAIQRMQDDIKKKQEEEAKKIEESRKFRLAGSGLVWRPSYLYCMGLYKGLAESDTWQRDLVKAVADSYMDHADVNNIKARLTVKLTECKFQAAQSENGINILLSMISDITAINKSILDTEKETAMNGYSTLQFINETIDSWINVNF